MAKTTAKKRPFVQIVGCVAGNLASSVLATRFTPEAGVGLAIMALACWLFSFYPAEKWIKERFREAPVNSSVAVLFFLGLLTFSRSSEREGLSAGAECDRVIGQAGRLYKFRACNSERAGQYREFRMCYDSGFAWMIEAHRGRRLAAGETFAACSYGKLQHAVVSPIVEPRHSEIPLWTTKMV